MMYTSGLLIILNWLFEGRWQEKWQMAKESRLLHAFWVMVLMYAVGLLWTSNLAEGLETLRSQAPLLLSPTIILTSRPLRGRARWFVVGCYVIAVTVVSIICMVRWMTLPDLPYREINPYISHIRFALNCCMVIFIVCSGEFVVGSTRCRMLSTLHSPLSTLLLRGLLTAWMLWMLLLLRSYTGFAVLAVAALVVTLYYRRWRWLAVWTLVVAGGLLAVGMGCRSYYKLVPMATEPLRPVTANGRPYLHQCDGLVENGNYVNNYICKEELRTEWARRSQTPIDSLTASGYPVENSLVRYLNALGLTKDSAGVAALTDSQMEEIASGVPTPVYGHGPLPQRMLYVMLFEYENARCYNTVDGFTMLQRIALWRCALEVTRQHLWLGTGTGDMLDEMHRVFVASGSSLQERNMHPHNQYLSLLTMFGVLGFGLIVVFFLRAARKPSSPFMLAWLTLVLVSLLTENTLDTIAGIMVCTWFLAFRSGDNRQHRQEEEAGR
jgi:hypothetical protein